MGDERQATGQWGERIAERYLRRRAGMRVLDRRWRHGRGELDLVMQQGMTLVFVEVRVRTTTEQPLATYRSIGRSKWRVLRRTALHYLKQYNGSPEAVRFDMVGIRRQSDGALRDLTHWRNVGTFGRNFRI